MSLSAAFELYPGKYSHHSLPSAAKLISCIGWRHVVGCAGCSGEISGVGECLGSWNSEELTFRQGFPVLRFSASFTPGAVIRTYSQPASIMRIDCSTVARVSMVLVVVMDCTRTGWFPPSGRLPMFTIREVYAREAIDYYSLLIFLTSFSLAKKRCIGKMEYTGFPLIKSRNLPFS